MPETLLSRDPVLTVEAVVDEPSGPHNRYAVDPRRRVPRLTAVIGERPKAAANVAHVPATAGDGIEPMRALLLSQLPIAPGSIVESRPIGISEGSSLLLLVPSVDPSYRDVEDPSQLPQEQVYQLRDDVERLAPDASPCIFLDRDAAAGRIRTQTERAKRAQAAARGTSRAIPYWSTGTMRGLRSQGIEGEPHTFAEYAVPLLPLRFQEYVARMLLDDERILLFLHRPAFRTARRPPLFRGRQLREGLLVVTDRQLLWMEDTIPPGITMVHWGFAAVLTGIERAENAAVIAGGDTASLALIFASSAGSEGLQLDFPAHSLPLLGQVVDLLAPFAARAPSRALRRLYAPSRDEGLEPPGWARALLDGDVVAWAEAEPTARGEGGRLALSRFQLGVTPDGGPSSIVELAAITSVRFTLSLLGCRLEAITAVETGRGESHLVRFQYPASDPFVPFVTALRSLLGNPPRTSCEVRQQTYAVAIGG